MTTADLLSALKANPFVLAPMAGITDRSFRTIMRNLGCGPVITELVSAHGIEFNSKKTIDLMAFDEVQRPFAIQLFGETPEILANAAKFAQEFGADFVDLNFGCPVPKVVKKGGGSAILKDLPRVAETFKTVKSAISIPLTVKIRTGWDENSRNADQVAHIAYEEGLSWVAIHGRTRSAGYSGWADWDYIAEVKAKSKIAILGNGDIATAQQAVDRMLSSGVDGVMIGRGCLKNPWIFKDSVSLWHSRGQNRLESPSMGARPQDFRGLFLTMKQTFEQNLDEKITMIQLRKFASWYSSGYPGAAQFRKTIFNTQTIEETMQNALSFFADMQVCQQADTSAEAFLMGGHG